MINPCHNIKGLYPGKFLIERGSKDDDILPVVGAVLGGGGLVLLHIDLYLPHPT